MDWNQAKPIGSILYEVRCRQVDIKKVTVHQDGPNTVFRFMLGVFLKQINDHLDWKCVVLVHMQDSRWKKEFERFGFYSANIVQVGDDTFEQLIRD